MTAVLPAGVNVSEPPAVRARSLALCMSGVARGMVVEEPIIREPARLRE